ncbi:hypothetical protein HO404_02235 [Streptococcus suis]|nr:hypothetical protein [Streptococcus suis]
MRARYYDSEAGTFLTEDSYQGELTNPLSQNRYSYVHNNPVNYTDPYRSSRFVRKTHLGCPACLPVFRQAASKVHWTFELPNTHHVECVALLVKA